MQSHCEEARVYYASICMKKKKGRAMHALMISSELNFVLLEYSKDSVDITVSVDG